MAETLGKVVSINIGKLRTVEWHGREITSGIWKLPVDGSVAVNGKLEGDETSDLRVHGGVGKAVYAYAAEDYDWWASTMPDTSFTPGLFGENLTTTGLALTEAVIGERWQVGSVEFEVRQPRFPCAKLGMRMGDAAFKDTFEDARRNGAYLGVVTPGRLEAGDAVVRVSQPDHGIRIADLVAAVNQDAPTDLLERILALPNLVPGMRKATARALTTLE